MEESKYWADQLARETVDRFPDKEAYTVASGISPSGVVHAGNFREIITSDLVAKALVELGEEVRFIYSWDDYDRFRKVPENVPQEFEEYIGLPVSEVPDPWDCHERYAEHWEQLLEGELDGLGIEVEFIRQNERFQSCAYSDEIRTALRNRDEIRRVLNKYREEPRPEDWWPIQVYCAECGKDQTRITGYDEDTRIEYRCQNCGSERTLDFSEEDSVKPMWRIDWPMRWFIEQVDFEPAGKEHSADGGSRDTANEIVREVYGREPPVHQMYEFVTRDGAKISASKGENTFSVSDLKEIYTSHMVRFLFAGTRPSKAFEIPIDSEDVIQEYEKFDRIESAYFNPEKMETDRKRDHWKRAYELSMLELPDEEPVRVPFKHASFVAQTVPQKDWREKGVESLQRTGHLPEDTSQEDVNRALERMEKARSWARDHAPEEYRYKLNQEFPETLRERFDADQRDAARMLGEVLREESFESVDELDSRIFEVKDETGLGTGEFFSTIYQVLLSRENGPRLSRLILSVGQEKAAGILSEA